MPPGEHHPFLNQSHEVDNIYYEDRKGMSVKLYRTMNTNPYSVSFLNARLGLTNYWDFYYVGDLYMGSNRDKVRVIWDTGSEWLTLMSYLCSTCNSFYAYDYSQELGDSWSRVEDSTRNTMNYGSVSSTGFRARDTVCLYNAEDACVPDFDIFMIEWQEGFPNYAGGIAGLATDSDNVAGPNLIKKFRDGGVIDDARFAFYLLTHHDTENTVLNSYVDIGFFRDDAMKDPSNL